MGIWSVLHCWDGGLVASLPKTNALLWVDASKRKILGTVELKDPRGVVFDAEGRLLALSGSRLLRYGAGADPLSLPAPTVLVTEIGADPNADEKRAKQAVGDLRLLVTQVNGKPMAQLYRAIVPGAKEPVPFSSPWRTITLDQVQDVTTQVELAGQEGNYEVSIPLTVLGLQPKPGQRIKGDVGILRGNGFQTPQRIYWANKASGITADVPSEAELTPALWGRREFVEP